MKESLGHKVWVGNSKFGCGKDLFMKNFLLLMLLAVAVLILFTGCVGSSTFGPPSRPFGLAPVGGSTLPNQDEPNQTVVREFGNYQFHHYQRTDLSVNTDLDEYGERVVDIDQSQQSSTSKSWTNRRRRYYAPTTSGPFTYPRSSGGVRGGGRVYGR